MADNLDYSQRLSLPELHSLESNWKLFSLCFAKNVQKISNPLPDSRQINLGTFLMFAHVKCTHLLQLSHCIQAIFSCAGADEILQYGRSLRRPLLCFAWCSNRIRANSLKFPTWHWRSILGVILWRSWTANKNVKYSCILWIINHVQVIHRNRYSVVLLNWKLCMVKAKFYWYAHALLCIFRYTCKQIVKTYSESFNKTFLSSINGPTDVRQDISI